MTDIRPDGDEEGLPATLRLWIDIGHPMRAGHLAAAIERLNRGVDAHATRRQKRRLELRVEAIQKGSVIADLAAVAGAVGDIGQAAWTLYERREVLLGFVNQLIDGVQWLLSAGKVGKKPNPTERTTLEALAAPVANDNARQVSVQVVGDNNMVLILTPDVCERMLPELRKLVGERTTKTTSPVAAPMPQTHMSQMPRGGRLPADHRSYSAQMIRVHGDWYVRLSSYDVTLPVRALGGGDLYFREGDATVTGRVVAKEGQPYAFDVTAISYRSKRGG